MNENRTTHLIEKLGMQHILSPILDSEEGYVRFERAIVDCLSRYVGKRPVVKGENRHSNSKLLGYSRARLFDTGMRFDPTFEFFKQYYGIGCNPKDVRQISEESNKNKQTVLTKIHFVENLLRQRHKTDIWYCAL